MLFIGKSSFDSNIFMKHIFYHGTSSFFLRSIHKYGLGSINPNKEWRLLDLLIYLYEISERRIQENKEYAKIRESTKAMTFQEQLSVEKGIYEGIHNFNHKNIYLSYGEIRAVIYAVNNEYGSEILTRIITLYRLLKKEDAGMDIPMRLNSIEIERIEKQHFFPLLIGVDNIDPSFLLTEYGESADKYLSIISELRNKLDYYSFWEKVQIYNFQSLMPISISQLTFYKVLYTGNIGSSNFTWDTIKL